MLRILFVSGQSAANGFLTPLWQRWQKQSNSPEFRIFIDPSVGSAISNITGLPVIRNKELGEILARTFMDWTPDVVVTSLSGKPLEKAAFSFAKEREIPICQFVDTWYDYALRIKRTNGGFDFPEQLLVIDEHARHEAIVEGVDPSIISVVGNPAWEHVTPFPAGDDKAVAFVSQPIANLVGDRLGYSENDAWLMVREAMRVRPEFFPRIVFAPHPNQEVTPDINGIDYVLNTH